MSNRIFTCSFILKELYEITNLLYMCLQKCCVCTSIHGVFKPTYWGEVYKSWLNIQFISKTHIPRLEPRLAYQGANSLCPQSPRGRCDFAWFEIWQCKSPIRILKSSDPFAYIQTCSLEIAVLWTLRTLFSVKQTGKVLYLKIAVLLMLQTLFSEMGKDLYLKIAVL